jgi:hypothetical protein
MSDATAPVAPVVDTLAPIAATPAAPVAADAEPAWLADRLERTKRSMLKDLGAENVDDVKAALADLKKRRDSEKTETDRLKARNAELEALGAKASAYETAIAERAAAAVASLTAEQREFVEESAAGDPLRILRLADKARAAFPGTSAAATQAAKAPIAAPASSSAAPGPAPATSQSTNHLATWESLKATNPIQAAHYLVAHTVEISEARKARS